MGAACGKNPKAKANSERLKQYKKRSSGEVIA